MANKSIFFITRSDVAEAPYPELALPALARDGWEITVAAPHADASLLRQVCPFPCRTITLQKTGWAGEAELLAAFMRARWRRPGVIYVNSQSLSGRARVALLGPLCGSRLVYHNPDFYDPLVYPVRAWLEGSLTRKADLCLNLEYHRGYICRTLYRHTCPVVTVPPYLPAAWPVAAPDERLRAQLSAGRDDAFVLILHGGLSARRMTAQLLRALARLPARFRLAMTGGEPPALKALLAELGLGARVTCLPRLDYLKLGAYTANADAGVLLYQNNDLGNFFTAPGRITEYLSNGLPLLAAHYTGLEALVLRHKLGVCVDPGRPEEIAAGITALAQAMQGGQFGRSAIRELFIKKFAFEHWEGIVVQAFNELLAGRARGFKAGPPQFPWMPGA